MTAALSELILAMSNALLIPDMVLLVFLAAWSVVQMGGCLSEWFQRRRFRGDVTRAVEALMARPDELLDPNHVPVVPGLLGFALRGAGTGVSEKWLEDAHLRAEGTLMRLHFGIRLGPILGLAGTLIPLGPALVAFASGNTEALAQNLVVAFTKTVVGVSIGGACYVIHAIRHRWYTHDLHDAEFLLGKVRKS